jgi:SPOR domain
MANRKDNPENENENLNEGNNADDNFGLPELDYKPLDTTEESTSTASNMNEENQVSESEESKPSYSYTPTEEPKSNAPIIIAVIIGLVLLASAFLIYQYVYKPKAEKAKKELLAKQEADKKRKEEEARLANEKEDAERRRLEEEKAAAATATPAIGTIGTLSERTGRYYVVVSSDIDDDLIMDFAKKLSAEGISSSIIPPSGKRKFYRIVIGNFDTFADAQANADQVKSKYGDGVWVIKY